MAETKRAGDLQVGDCIEFSYELAMWVDPIDHVHRHNGLTVVFNGAKPLTTHVYRDDHQVAVYPPSEVAPPYEEGVEA
jgi:hypothetical protein